MATAAPVVTWGVQMIKTITIAALAFAGSGVGLSSLLHDGAQFDETIPASKEGIVTVRVTDGAVSIGAWDRDEIRVAGSGVNRDALDLQSSHNHTIIRIQPDSGSPDDLQLTITVPQGSSIDVETDGAQVDVEGVEGVVRLASNSGKLTVAGRPASIVAMSHSGDIDIRAPGAEGFVHSEEGTVLLQGGSSGNIVARRGAARSRVNQTDRRRNRESTARAAQRRQREIQREADRMRSAIERQRSNRQCCSDRALGDAIERIVRESAWALDGLQGLVDIERSQGRLEINIADAIGVDLDLDALEEMMESMGEEISEQMEELAEQLDERYRNYADEFERNYRGARRNRR